MRPYVRLLRASDIPRIKELHRELFGFDIVVGDAALTDAVTSSRWLCLAAVQALPGGGEDLAGFVMSAVASVKDFETGDYFESSEDEEDTTESATDSDAANNSDASGSSDIVTDSTSSTGRGMGLQHLGLQDDDVTVNVCLLATLPKFRRSGVASQLFSQVINSARNARAKAIFLHVLPDNAAAISFYQRMNFKTAARIPNFYTLSQPATLSSHNETAASTSTPADAVSDALLLSVLVSEVSTPSVTSASANLDPALSTSSSAFRGARSGSTSTTATSSTGGKSSSTPPAPKMRGLMGGGGGGSGLSSAAAAAYKRKQAAAAAPTSTSTSGSSSGSSSSSSNDNAGKSQGPSFLSGLTALFGGGGKARDNNKQNSSQTKTESGKDQSQEDSDSEREVVSNGVNGAAGNAGARDVRGSALRLHTRHGSLSSGLCNVAFQRRSFSACSDVIARSHAHKCVGIKTQSLVDASHHRSSASFGGRVRLI